PVVNTEDAQRRNRRTEIIFARIASLPCEVPQPVTFDLPPPDGAGSGWCLGPGDPNKRCCFLRRKANGNDLILVQPANPAHVRVQGRMEFEDGRDAAGIHYVLVAPDGEYMDGEIGAPGDVRRGTPIEGVTGSHGEFSYDRDKGVGVWILEVQKPHVLAR